jgi:hypothetical protein
MMAQQLAMQQQANAQGQGGNSQQSQPIQMNPQQIQNVQAQAQPLTNQQQMMMRQQQPQMLNQQALAQQNVPGRQPNGLSQKESPQKTGPAETAGEVNSEEISEKSTSSAPVGDTEMKFTLSEEFTFIFRECSSSDVLQLLKDNWHHYSQWIDGAHMNWQNAAFLESSTQLKNSLGTCLVQSAKGSLPLQETVLPMIDRQLDEGRHIPAVTINDPQHPEWTLLSYFGVIMKGDAQYYLRCLISVSEEHRPDVDSVAYIYEQLQARYRENEELIRYVSRGGEDL